MTRYATNTRTSKVFWFLAVSIMMIKLKVILIILYDIL